MEKTLYSSPLKQDQGSVWKGTSPYTSPTKAYRGYPSLPPRSNQASVRQTRPYDQFHRAEEIGSTRVLYSDYCPIATVHESPSKTEKSSGSSVFNPRAAASMSHGEKVPLWIENIPTILTETQCSTSCYPATLDEDYEEIEFLLMPSVDEISEVQARRVTFLCIQLYLNEMKDPVTTPETILGWTIPRKKKARKQR